MKNKYGVSQKICIAISWTLTVALMVTIFCLSSQVSSKSSGLSSGVISRITELFHITLTQHTVRKTAHALEYAALCFLFSCSWQSVFLKSQHTLSFLSAALGRASPIFCVRQSVPAERHTCGLSRCVIRPFGVFYNIYCIYSYS